MMDVEDMHAGRTRADLSTFEQLHDSLVSCIANALGVCSRLSLLLTSKTLRAFEHGNATFWHRIDSSLDEKNIEAQLLLACLRKALRQGGVRELSLKKSSDKEEAAIQEALARFKQGLKYCDVSPYTAGGGAVKVAALLPNITELAIDERTCCLGGMTDDFAKAIAGCCPHLTRLEVKFSPGPVARLAAEQFTDEGLSTLAERCTGLKAVTLSHCIAITDRSMYSLAAYCKLQELRIKGYSEQVSDMGLTILLQATASTLTVCHLSGKLWRVTDKTAAALLLPPAAWKAGRLRSGHMDVSMHETWGFHVGEDWYEQHMSTGSSDSSQPGSPTHRALASSLTPQYDAHDSMVISDHQMAVDASSAPATPQHLSMHDVDAIMCAELDCMTRTAFSAQHASSLAHDVPGHARKLTSLKLSQGITDSTIDMVASIHTYRTDPDAMWDDTQVVCCAPDLQSLHIAHCRAITAASVTGLIQSAICPSLKQLHVSLTLARSMPCVVRDVRGGGVCYVWPATGPGTDSNTNSVLLNVRYASSSC